MRNYPRLAIAAALVQLASISSAQPMQEVIVYSSLAGDSVKDTAGSLSIFDENDINRGNTQHIEQLLNAAPNVNFSGGASRARFVQMRGIGDIEQFVDPKPHPSIGLVVDGIDFSGLFGAGLLFDTQQVEVMRGPQGTAFGASALAGAINIVSNTATNTDGGFVEAGVGKFASRQLGGAVSGTLTENTRARLAARQYRSDGHIENQFLNREDTGKQDEFIAKLNLDSQGENGNALKLTAIHIDNDNGYDAFSLGNTGVVTQSDQPGKDVQRISALSVSFSEPIFADSKIEYRLSWLRAGTNYSFDEDWADPSICNPPASCGFGFFSSADSYKRLRDDYSAEFKLSSDEYVLGFFAQDRDVGLLRNRIGTAPLSFSSQYNTQRLALFAQRSASIGDSTTAQLGGRYEWFTDDYLDSNATASDSRDELWQVQGSIKQALSKEAQLYLLASRGNKGGGVNTDATTNVGAIDPSFQTELMQRLRYSKESLSNYEMGVDFQSDDGSLAGKVAVFYNYRNNPQFETFLYDNLSSFLFVGYQDNADYAESHGVEVQFSQRFNRHFSVQYSAAYMESSIRNFRVYDFDLGAYRAVGEKEQPRAGGYQYHITTSYAVNERLEASITAEGRDSYEFAYYFDRQSGHVNLLHANLQYKTERVTLSAWLRNLRDSAYPVQGLYFGNDPRDSYSQNRLYTQLGESRNGGVSFRYHF